MYRLVLLCLLIAGCGTAHGSTIRVRRAKSSAKKPAAVVSTKTAAVRDLAPVSSKGEAVPAAAIDPISEAARKEKEKRANKFEKLVIDIISTQRDDDPLPVPGPPGPPVPSPHPPDAVPFLTLPATVEGDIGEPLEIVAQTNCKRVHWYVVDKGLKKFPDGQLANPVATVVWSLQPGQYRLTAFAASGDEPIGPVEVMIVVHGAQPPPVPPTPPFPPPPLPPPPPAPPPAPAPVQAARLWVVVVNNATGVDPVTAKLLGDVSFWNSVQAQGHQFRNYNTTQPEYQKYKSIVAANGGVPCIILMNADDTTGHNWLNKNPGEGGIPLSGTIGVRALINKYTSRPVP